LSAIARSMAISYKTVANTCVIIKKKFGLKQTADLRRLAIQLGRV
jgi:two-component system, NarL family, invasion response regulator UvrY